MAGSDQTKSACYNNHTLLPTLLCLVILGGTAVILSFAPGWKESAPNYKCGSNLLKISMNGPSSRGEWLGKVHADLYQLSSTKTQRCSGSDAQEQADHYMNSVPIEKRGCAHHVWLPRLQAMAPAGHKIFLDIGCNKGMHSMELFDMFAPELGISKRAMQNVHTPLKSSDEIVECGACRDDCTSPLQTPLLVQGGRTIEVHCMEPSNIHYPNLKAARAAIFKADPETSHAPVRRVDESSGIWHLHNMAFSNTTGTATFTSDCTTNMCHLEFNSQKTQYSVQVNTVDLFLESIGSPRRVQFMKIDVEGFDALVLQGAEKSLRNKVIQVLVFEYHMLNHWSQTQLKDVTDWLLGIGYVCYFEGDRNIYKISGSCWNQQYEFHQWSNVVCGVAGGAVELMLDAHSYLRVLRTKSLHSSVA